MKGLLVCNVVLTLYCQFGYCQYKCEVKYPELINCNTHHYFDLSKEFQRISKIQRRDEENFEELLLFNTQIDILNENTFSNITFKQISIQETKKLTYIHTNAFSGPTLNTTRKLYITGTNKLRNNPPNYDIYQAFTSLPNLESIAISLETETSHEMPENAFYRTNSRQNFLNEIVFKGEFSLKAMKNYAFYGLTHNKLSVTFDYIPIEYISSRAFDLEKYSEGVIDIYLKNCSLTESCFGNNVFSGSKRRLNIDLSKKISFSSSKT